MWSPDFIGQYGFTPGSWNDYVNLNTVDGISPLHGVVEVAPLDAQAPTTNATPSPNANAVGWNNANVDVLLSANDNADGTGVREIVFSASGAQTIGLSSTPRRFGICPRREFLPYRFLRFF